MEGNPAVAAGSEVGVWFAMIEDPEPCGAGETEPALAAARIECTGSDDAFLAFAAAGPPEGWERLASPPPQPYLAQGLEEAWAHAFLAEPTANCGALDITPCGPRIDLASPAELVRLVRYPEPTTRVQALDRLARTGGLTVELVVDRLGDDAWCDGCGPRWTEDSVAAAALIAASTLSRADQAKVVAAVAGGDRRVPPDALAMLWPGDDPAVREGLLATYGLAREYPSPAWVTVAAFRDPRDLPAIQALPDARFLAAVARFPHPGLVERLRTLPPSKAWFGAALAYPAETRDPLIEAALERDREARGVLVPLVLALEPDTGRVLWERWLEAPWARELPYPELRTPPGASPAFVEARDLYALELREAAARRFVRLARGPEGEGARWNLGIVLVELGRLRRGVAVLLPLIDALPVRERVTPLAFLANTFWAAGEHAEARAMSSRLREADPALWRLAAFKGRIVAPYPGQSQVQKAVLR